MENVILYLNKAAEGFWSFSGSMLIQSGILIVLLLVIDRLIRKRVRAVFRYCIWMLVFVKLLLPPSLCLPTGVGYWCGLERTEVKSAMLPPEQTDVFVAEQGLQERPEASNLEQPTQSQRPAITNDNTHIPPQQSEALAVAAPTVSLTWQAFIFLGWGVGVLVLSVLLIQRFLFVKSLIAQSEPAQGRVLETLNQCREQVGLNRSIQLRLTANMLSPAACGLLNPVILIPASLLGKLTKDKLKTVLIHELAHIKRGDLWVNFLQTVLQIAYFYNPLLWIANAVVRGIREKAVDEMVLTKLGDQADTYSNTLIDIAEIAFSRPHFSLRLIGVVESKSALTDRIRHILSRPFPKSAKIGLVGLAAIFITAAVLLPMAKGKPKIDWRSHGITIKAGSPEKNEYPIGSQLMGEYMEALFTGDEAEIARITTSANPATQQLRLSFNEIDKLKSDYEDSEFYPSSRRTITSADPQNTIKIGLFSGGRIKRVDGVEYSLLALIVQEDNHTWQLKDVHWYRMDKELEEAHKLIDREMAHSIAALLENAKPAGTESVDAEDIEKDLNQTSQEILEKLAEDREVSNDSYPGLYSKKVTPAKEDVVQTVRSFLQALKDGSVDSKELRCPGSLTHRLSSLLDQCNVDSLMMTDIYASDNAAIVLTEGGQRYDDLPYQVGFTLFVYPGGKWVFNDTDWLASEDRSDFIEGFKRNYPDVNHVYTRGDILATNSNYTATLPNGVTVELLGICKDPTKTGQQWWKPDARIRDELTFELKNRHPYDEPYFGYMLQFMPSEDLTFRTETDADAFISTSAINEEGRAIAWLGYMDGHNDIPEIPETASITVKVAGGNWQIREPGQHEVFRDVVNFGDERILLSGLRSDPDDSNMTLIEATTSGDDVDIQLVCINKNGKSYDITHAGMLRAGGKMIQHSFSVPIQIDEIEKIIVNYRKFHTVTFKNVSLRPGGEREGKSAKTVVQIDGKELDKLARQDIHEQLAKKDARGFAEEYLKSLSEKDWDLAASMCRPGSKQARNAHLLGEMCDFSDAGIDVVYSNRKMALATTDQLKQVDGRQWQLGFTLQKERMSWIIEDIDWIPEDEKENFIKKFLSTFPDAKNISLRPGVKTEVEIITPAVPVERGNEINGLPAADEIVWVFINDPGVDEDGDGTPDHESFNGEMSKYETTNAQYCKFLNEALASGDITVIDTDTVVGASGSNAGEDFINQRYYDLAGRGYTYKEATNGGAARINYNGSVFSVDNGFENHPVTYVSWYGSTAFCNYYGYRLPTEWQWQAVADYDGSFTYGCGKSINNSIANYEYNSTLQPDGTSIVGSFGAYGYGMCDMAGNVWEWTSSIGHSVKKNRIVRGGSWHFVIDGGTVSDMTDFGPEVTADYHGFRVCRLGEPKASDALNSRSEEKTAVQGEGEIRTFAESFLIALRQWNKEDLNNLLADGGGLYSELSSYRQILDLSGMKFKAAYADDNDALLISTPVKPKDARFKPKDIRIGLRQKNGKWTPWFLGNGIAGDTGRIDSFLSKHPEAKYISLRPSEKTEGEIETQSSVSSPQSPVETKQKVHGYVTDALGRPHGNVYITNSLSNLRDAKRTDQNGQFSFELDDPSQTTWVASSRPIRAVGLFTIPKEYKGQPLHVPLDLTDAKVEGRIVGPDGKGLANRKMKLFITTDQGIIYQSQCYGKTDQYGCYDSPIPCGDGLTVQAKLADADESEKDYASQKVALKDGQIYVEIPTFVVGQGNPEISDEMINRDSHLFPSQQASPHTHTHRSGTTLA